MMLFVAQAAYVVAVDVIGTTTVLVLVADEVTTFVVSVDIV